MKIQLFKFQFGGGTKFTREFLLGSTILRLLFISYHFILDNIVFLAGHYNIFKLILSIIFRFDIDYEIREESKKKNNFLAGNQSKGSDSFVLKIMSSFMQLLYLKKRW